MVLTTSTPGRELAQRGRQKGLRDTAPAHGRKHAEEVDGALLAAERERPDNAAVRLADQGLAPGHRTVKVGQVLRLVEVRVAVHHLVEQRHPVAPVRWVC